MMRKCIAICLVAAMAAMAAHAQQIQGQSGSGSFYISKAPPKPPYLFIEDHSLLFRDSDGNKMIDANENALIQFELRNTGQGPGLDLRLSVVENNQIQGLSFGREKSLGTIQPGDTLRVEVPLIGKMDLGEGKASFAIAVREANGFGTDPVFIEVRTRAFIPPDVQIVDHSLTSKDSRTLEKKRPFEVQVLVQNLGQGTAEDITVNLDIPDNTFCLSGNEKTKLGTLPAGSTKLLEYDLVANNLYAEPAIPLQYKLHEKYGKYAKNKTITLTLNQSVSEKKLTVEGEEKENTAIQMASLSSVVDKNIPFNKEQHPNRFALIMGNEDYQSKQPGLSAEQNVEFAARDAEIFSRYCERTLGIPPDNITLLRNASAAEMTQNLELVSKLASKIQGSEIIFYYAGHGFPDENNRTPYLMPVDVHAGNLSAAIRLRDVCQTLGSSGAEKVTLFIDACFSGGGREAGLLAARSVKIAPKEEALVGNTVLFSASSGEQSALPYSEEQHGMFTYYLLKKMQETKGIVAYSELYEFIRQKVSVESLRVNKKEQDPKVHVSSNVQGVWKTWTLK